MWRLAKVPFLRRLGQALRGVDDAQHGRPAPSDPPLRPSEISGDDRHHRVEGGPRRR